MDDFPKLVNNRAENSLREGKWGCRVFPTFSPNSAKFARRKRGERGGGGKRGRLHRWELEARFLSAGRRASKSALFILLVENGVEIFGKKEKLFGW